MSPPSKVAVRRLLVLIPLALLAVLALGCSVGGGDLATRSSGTSAAASTPDVSGTWVYGSGASGGSITSASGELELTADGKFHDKRFIDGTGAERRGSYTVNSDKLTLASDDGRTEVYGYSLGTQTDPKGVKADTLSLKGDDLSFLLTRKPK